MNQVNEDLAFAHYLHKVDHTQVAFSAKIIIVTENHLDCYR